MNSKGEAMMDDSGPFPRLVDVSAKENNRIEFTYETGERRLFDMTPHIRGSWMGELADPAYFAQVSIEPMFRDTVVWPHEQDVAPHELYEMSVPLDNRD